MPVYFYILYFIFSYLLGAIPFSYLVTKIATKQNVFEVGWKKSSASNVIKNVGKVPGIIAFLLDVGKGLLVVVVAQYLGFNPFLQALAGLLAIFGHNWSVFVGGRGGRGLATLVGAIFGLSPMFLLIIVIPCIVFTFIWTASIGTILSLIFGIFLGLTQPAWQPAGLLLLLSLIPVFAKRLSPINEIQNADESKKRELIENRLLFDQDAVPEFRMKFFKKK
jgi:glycerol-3-phosphate acyltransferase PlsY